MNKYPKIIQSFWTKPSRENLFTHNRLKMELYVIALSSYYANRSGANITMYTDDFGYKLLEYLPYENIIVKLNDISVPKKVFAYSKFVTMKDLPLGYIHIDNDVFIKSEKCVKEMQFNDYDIIVQSKDLTDYSDCHRSTEKTYMHLLKKYEVDKYIDDMIEFNCGVIGINNEQLKHDYFNLYFNLIKESRTLANYTAPDILFEQYVLYFLVKKHNYKIKYVLNDLSDADKIGYQHVLSSSKWNNIDKIKKLLKYYSPELYNKTNEKIKMIEHY